MCKEVRGHVQTGTDAKAVNTGKALGLLSSFALSYILLLFLEADVFCQLLTWVAFRAVAHKCFCKKIFFKLVFSKVKESYYRILLLQHLFSLIFLKVSNNTLMFLWTYQGISVLKYFINI